MHDALKIPELIDLIILHLSSQCEEPSGVDVPWRTLLAAGLTCHAFLEPALDHIWRFQKGLSHLVEVLPEDLWFLSEDGTLVCLPRHLAVGQDVLTR